MTTIAFPLPCRLLSMNDRLHWRKQRDLTRAWRRTTMVAALQVHHGLDDPSAAFVSSTVYSMRRPIEAAFALLGRAQMQPPLAPSIVTVTLPVRDRRARDPHNYFATVKPVVDGLVDAGLWPDDTPEWVTTTEPRLVPQAPAVVIEITRRPTS